MIDYKSELVMAEHWDHWIKDVQSYFEAGAPLPIFNRAEYKLQGRHFDKNYVIGSEFDNYGQEIVDEDCPKCGHYLCKADIYEHDGKFCTGCDYVDEAMIQYNLEQEKKNEHGRTFYMEHLDPYEYAEKLGIVDVKNRLLSCGKCETKLDHSGLLRCFRTSNGYGGVSLKCPSCGACGLIATPVTDEAKAFFGKIF